MKRGRQTQSNGTSISEACFNDLLKHNLISEEIWMPKEKGIKLVSFSLIKALEKPL